jgi:hypothetical protein
MKIRPAICSLPAFLWLLCVITSYGQVMPKRTQLTVASYEGEVVLTTGVRLWGHLSYKLLTNTLLIRQANTSHTYQAEQLRYFTYTDQNDKRVHYVTAFAVRLASGETRTLLLEELIPGAPIPLLQLPPPNGKHEAIMLGLPQPRTTNWQTEPPCYVWFDGWLLAPDVFVRTEIDALLTIAPEPVQRWAAAYPRPTCLPELARWLYSYRRQLSLVPPRLAPVQPKPATTPANISILLY